MIDCLIVDDEEYSVDLLAQYVKQIPSLNLVKATTNPVEAIMLINRGNVQLAFCDIQMPDVSGLDIARSAADKCKLIFTTAYSEFAIGGYEHNIIDYLLKPIAFPRFLMAVEKALNLIQQPKSQDKNDDHIYVKLGVKGKLLKIDLIDIEYIKSDRNYIIIHHRGKKTMVNSSMKEIEGKISDRMFIRVHKSFIVALSQITGIEGNKVLIKNNTEDILLSDTYRASFFDIIKNRTLE